MKTKWESTPSEQIHTQFIKSILGVNRSTTNLQGSRQNFSTIRHYLPKHRLHKDLANKPSTLVKPALDYESLLTEQRTTILNVFNMHENRLKTYFKNNEDIKTISESKLIYIRNKIFDSIWLIQLNNYPKPDTYKQFKPRLKFECYLNEKNRKLRVSYTKLRVSDHKLMSEVGRRKRPPIPRDQRFCPFCPLQIENESYFLLTNYKGRMELLNEIQVSFRRFNDNELDIHSKLLFVMSQEHTKTTNLLLNHVRNWQKRRDETLHPN